MPTCISLERRRSPTAITVSLALSRMPRSVTVALWKRVWRTSGPSSVRPSRLQNLPRMHRNFLIGGPYVGSADYAFRAGFLEVPGGSDRRPTCGRWRCGPVGFAQGKLCQYSRSGDRRYSNAQFTAWFLVGVVSCLTAFRGYHRGGNNHTDKSQGNDEVMHRKVPWAASVQPHLWESSGEGKNCPIQLSRDAALKVLLREGTFLVRGDGNLDGKTLKSALILPIKCVNVKEIWAKEICLDSPGCRGALPRASVRAT